MEEAEDQNEWKATGTYIKLTLSDIHTLDSPTVSSSARLPCVWWLVADLIHTRR